MHLFKGSTADEAWVAAAAELLDVGRTTQPSRAGHTVELLHTAIVISDPRERWVRSRQPPINPAFGIVEAIWVLTGRNDSKLVNHWNPQLPKFAGTGQEYNGAYGRRLRSSFGLDQIQRAIDSLEHNPITRQVVLQIWSSELDAPYKSGLPRSDDVPCNVSSLLKVRDNQLYWMQLLRSNDLLRGTPYNIIQFTVLQEFIAGCLGLDLGQYTQVSDSLHVYVSDLPSFQACRSHQHGATASAVFSLPRSEAFEALDAMEKALDGLADSTTPHEFEKILDSSLPPGHSDLFMIAAADSARRRNWRELQVEAARRCRDLALAEVWKAWETRTKAESYPTAESTIPLEKP